jgi:hypothetical protein
MGSKAKTKTKDFLIHIRVLGQNSSNRIVDGFQGREKELIARQRTALLKIPLENEAGRHEKRRPKDRL